MEPGFVMDMFAIRARYDIRIHGLKRKKPPVMSVGAL